MTSLVTGAAGLMDRQPVARLGSEGEGVCALYRDGQIGPPSLGRGEETILGRRELVPTVLTIGRHETLCIQKTDLPKIVAGNGLDSKCVCQNQTSPPSGSTG